MKIMRGRALFIGPESSGRPAKGCTSGGSCSVVQRLSHTSMYYPEGTQKVAYIQWSCVRPPVRFAERMSGGPPAYVRTTDNSIRPPKSPNHPSSSLSDPKPKLIPPTKPLMPS
jgi:hypothetical protein